VIFGEARRIVPAANDIVVPNLDDETILLGRYRRANLSRQRDRPNGVAATLHLALHFIPGRQIGARKAVAALHDDPHAVTTKRKEREREIQKKKTSTIYETKGAIHSRFLF